MFKLNVMSFGAFLIFDNLISRKMAGRRVKRMKIWASGTRIQYTPQINSHLAMYYPANYLAVCLRIGSRLTVCPKNS